MLSMTGNAGTTAVFHFLFIFGASAPLYMSSRKRLQSYTKIARKWLFAGSLCVIVCK